jgi:uncharacterized phage infection (PIP) family protein YhgE
MADEFTRELSELASTAKRTKAAVPPSRSAPMPIYDFEHLGETLSDSLVQAAEDLSAEAQQIANRLTEDAHQLANNARTLAADIRLQVSEQSKLLADINNRLKASGEQVLEAQRKFNGGA